MANTKTLTSLDREKTKMLKIFVETRSLQASRHDRDVEVHVVINAVVN